MTAAYQRVCMKFSLADLLLFFVLLFGTFLKCKYLAGGLQSGQDPPSAKMPTSGTLIDFVLVYTHETLAYSGPRRAIPPCDDPKCYPWPEKLKGSAPKVATSRNGEEPPLCAQVAQCL